jgi:hypothetical protein
MKRILLFSLLLSSPLFALSQTQSRPAAGKFKVYKAAIDPNTIRNGVRGIGLLFSCEYNFAEGEYPAMQNAAGKVMFRFYLSLKDKNNEPVYNAFDFAQAPTDERGAGRHFAEEWAYAPTVKTQGRRNTGIELFVPYAHLPQLPEGNQEVRLSINVLNEKAGRFENAYGDTLTVAKPALYWVTVNPKRASFTATSGKKYELSVAAEELAVVLGNNPKGIDVLGTAGLEVGKSLAFVHSEGDALQLLVRKSTATGRVGAFEERKTRDTGGKPLPATDLAPLTGRWPLGTAALPLQTKQLSLNLELNRTKIPPVRLAGLQFKAYALQDNVSGVVLSFTYETNLPASLPPPVAVFTYPGPGGQAATLRFGKVLSGKATADSSGALRLERTGSSAVTVFYPFAALVLNDANLKANPPNRLQLEVRPLGYRPAISRKEMAAALPASNTQDARLPATAAFRDTTWQGERGVALVLPWQMSPLYQELLQPEYRLTLAAGTDKDLRSVELLHNMQFMTEAVGGQVAGKNEAGFRLNGPTGRVALFVPYYQLTNLDLGGSFAWKLHLHRDGNSTEVGKSNLTLRPDFDRNALRYVSIGVSETKLKAAGGVVRWRLRSSGGATIYESPVTPGEKEVKSYYRHAAWLPANEKIKLEILQGANASSLAAILTWEFQPSELKATGEKELSSDPLRATVGFAIQ